MTNTVSAGQVVSLTAEITCTQSGKTTSRPAARHGSFLATCIHTGAVVAALWNVEIAKDQSAGIGTVLLI